MRLCSDSIVRDAIFFFFFFFLGGGGLFFCFFFFFFFFFSLFFFLSFSLSLSLSLSLSPFCNSIRSLRHFTDPGREYSRACASTYPRSEIIHLHIDPSSIPPFSPVRLLRPHKAASKARYCNISTYKYEPFLLILYSSKLYYY